MAERCGFGVGGAKGEVRFAEELEELFGAGDFGWFWCEGYVCGAKGILRFFDSPEISGGEEGEDD